MFPEAFIQRHGFQLSTEETTPLLSLLPLLYHRTSTSVKPLRVRFQRRQQDLAITLRFSPNLETTPHLSLLPLLYHRTSTSVKPLRVRFQRRQQDLAITLRFSPKLTCQTAITLTVSRSRGILVDDIRMRRAEICDKHVAQNQMAGTAPLRSAARPRPDRDRPPAGCRKQCTGAGPMPAEPAEISAVAAAALFAVGRLPSQDCLGHEQLPRVRPVHDEGSYRAGRRGRL